MATLQKIRSKGALLLAVIGLALLAFILGDAWKIMRPNQGVVTVGEINGKSINAQDFQNEVEKYSDVVKLSMNTSSLTDEQYASVKDEVWSSILRKTMLGNEASAIGLKVTDAEIQGIIEDGTNSILRQTPFQNDQTGEFDVDKLRNFLALYQDLDRSSQPAELINQYDDIYNYWCYVEDNLRDTRLVTKYLALVQAGMASNPVSRKNSYETRVKRSDVLLATLPYTSVEDSLVKVTAADIKKLYDERKETYLQLAETRDINYIDVEILPSESDRAALLDEVSGYAQQLGDTEDELASFIRLTESAVPYSEVPVSKNGLPEDVASRLDSVKTGEVCGPYYYAADDSYNAFKIISTVDAYDSIQFSAIQVLAADADATAKLADSIYNVVLQGADMQELAAKYSQTGEPQWLASADYEGGAYSGDNATYLNTVSSMKKGEVRNLKLSQVTMIIKVTDLRNPVKKYNTAIVKRAAYFSNETSNEAYNKLSAFVASNNTAELLEANAEDNGYRLLSNPDFQSFANNVGSVAKSHDALRWVFDAKPGDVSRIYEVGEENDHLLVVALNKIHKQGYRTIEDVQPTLQFDALKEKKAEMLLAKFSDTSDAGLKAISGIRIDTVKYVNFATPAYLQSTFSSEPLIGAAISGLKSGEASAPIKGEGGVWVARKIADDTYSTEYDDEAEKIRLRSLNSRVVASQVLQELYLQSNVKDTRYKTF